MITKQQVYSQSDFSERLKLEFNNQVQEEYYFGGATISIEGAAVKFYPSGEDTTAMEFFTYLSDGKQQDSSIVHNHMEKLIKHLKEQGIIRSQGCSLICTTDGAASQYRSGTAFYFLSVLAVKYNLAISRCIQAPGHGKGWSFLSSFAIIPILFSSHISNFFLKYLIYSLRNC